MNKIICAAVVAILCIPAFAGAQEVAFCHEDALSPNRYMLVMSSEAGIGYNITRVDGPIIFEGFSLGGSDDLPQSELDRFDELVSSLAPNEALCLQGTTDKNPWDRRRHAEKTDAQNDVGLGITRAVWMLDRAGRRGAMFNTPLPNQDHRGVHAYVARVSPVPTPLTRAEVRAMMEEAGFVTEAQVRALIARMNLVDEDRAREIVREELRGFDGVGVGFGIGFGGVVTSGMTFYTPHLSLVFTGERTSAVFSAGWVQSGSSEAFGPTAESSASVEFARYMWRSRSGALQLGPAVNVAAGWLLERKSDDFIERAYVVGVGPRVRWRMSDYTVLMGGVDVGIANQDAFGWAEERWSWAVVPAIRFSYHF